MSGLAHGWLDATWRDRCQLQACVFGFEGGSAELRSNTSEIICLLIAWRGYETAGGPAPCVYAANVITHIRVLIARFGCAYVSCSSVPVVHGGVCRCSLGASVALWSRRRGFYRMSSAVSTVLLSLSLTASFTSSALVEAADEMRSDETRLSRGKVLLGWVESKLPCRVVSCRVKPSSFLVSASHHRLEVCQVALNGSLAHSGSQ